MKKKAILFTIAIALAVTAGKIFAGQSKTAEAPQKKEAAALINYVWYSDPDLTYLVGTYSDVNTELNRLRAIYPFNIFSATPVGMANPYEFGYYQYSVVAIIFSDL